MSDTVDDLRQRRALLVARYEKVIAGPASHSTGDRSFSEWDPATLRREIDALDDRLTKLTQPGTSGYTLLRHRRGRG